MATQELLLFGAIKLKASVYGGILGRRCFTIRVQVSHREVIAIYLFVIESSKQVSCPACNDREEKLSVQTSWINLGQIYDLPRSDQLGSLLRMYDRSKITADQDNGQFSDGSKHRRIIIFSLTQKSIIQCHTALSEEQEEERI